MRPLVWLLALGLAWPIQGRAEVQTEVVCKKYKNVPFPPGDRPAATEKKALAGCSSENLYYGFGVKADPIKARKCAYAEVDRGDEGVFSGSAMLMTIYANGRGARRNLEIALRIACALDGAPAEREGRVADLLARKRSAAARAKAFHICDAATSGLMAGHCTAHFETPKKLARTGRLGRLTAKWPPAAKAKFRALRKAATTFFDARENNEVDLSGTMRAALMEEERARLEKGFLRFVERLERGTLPRFTTRQFRATEKRLNVVYGRIMRAKRFEYGTITQEGIRKAERAWLPYREAWVAFGALRYPQVTAESWRTALARERIRQLEEFAGAVTPPATR